MTLLIVATIVLLAMLMGGVWIAIGMMLVGVVLLVFGGMPQLLPGISFAAWGTINSFTLTALPLFIFMSEVLSRSQVMDKVFDGLVPLFGRLRGGLMASTIAACGLFSAVSGSSLAAVATIGKMSLTNLIEHGYSKRLAYGVVTSGGVLGILIPPSIPLIVYGGMIEGSVAQLFMGALVPGLLLMFLLGGTAVVLAWLSPPTMVAGPVPRLKVRLVGLTKALPLLGLFLLIMGGLYSGIATPTEIASVAAFGSIIVAVSYGGLRWKGLKQAFLESVVTSSSILFIVMGAFVLQWGLVATGLITKFTEVVISLALKPWVILAAIYLLYLILGMFLESLSMIVMTLPVVYPIILKMGFDPVWLGVILVILIEVGLLTPPVGFNLFVTQRLVNAPLMEVAVSCLPYYIPIFVTLILVTVFPSLVLWLPAHMFG